MEEAPLATEVSMRRSLVLFMLALALALAARLAGAEPPDREWAKQARGAGNDPVQAIPVHLDLALKLAEQAKAEDKPARFVGARSVLARAEQLLGTLKSRKGDADADYQRLKAQYEQAKRRIDELESQQGQQSLEAARMPPELYSGHDKGELRRLIREEWTRLYPKDEVLAIRFHHKDWTRDAGAQWNETDRKAEAYDKSVLAALVVVKTSDVVATMYGVFLNRSNLSGKLSVGADTKGPTYVQKPILLRHVEADHEGPFGLSWTAIVLIGAGVAGAGLFVVMLGVAGFVVMRRRATGA